MARITVEDCLVQENNRFALVQLASKRTKQLLAGSRTLTSEAKGNKAVVTSLREIAEGAVRFMTPEDEEKLRLLEAQNEAYASEQTPEPNSGDDLFTLPSELRGETGDDDDEDEDDDDASVDDASPSDDE